MFEDNVWDEFGENDDLIVPHSGNKHKNQFVIQGDGCKKSLHELHGIRSNDCAGGYGSPGKEELYLENMTQKGRMSEKDSWSHTPEGVYSSCDSDSYKEAKRLNQDDTGMSDHCFKGSNIDSGGSEVCADDTILEDQCVVEDDSMCQYPINHVSQADNELSFLDNDGWLDIGNFEDVDRMLSYNSTFGMESFNNEEEFCWLSSSQGAEGSGDALKSDFKFSCAEMSQLKNISDYGMESKENIGFLPNDFIKNSSPGDKKMRSQMDVDNNGIPFPASLSMFSESEMKTGHKGDLGPKEKLHKKLPKSSPGRQKNGDPVYPYTSPKQYADIKQCSGASSSGVTSLDSAQKHKLNRDSDSLGCTPTQIPIMHPDFSHAPNHTSLVPTLSVPRSEHDGHLSPLKGSSYMSNMESYHGHSLEAAAVEKNEREKLYHSRGEYLLSRSFKNGKMANEMPLHSPGSSEQVAHQFENESEGHSKIRGVSLGISSEIDLSTVQESYALNPTSVEATSFCHLQQVLDQACDSEEDGLFGFDLHSDGSGQRHLNASIKENESNNALDSNGSVRGFPPKQSSYSCIQMNGKEVFRFAVRCVPQSIEAALQKSGLHASSIDWLLLHQANQRIIDAVATRLQLPSERVISNLANYGNTSAASIPLALDEAVRSGKVKAGQTIATAGFGAGLTWGSAILRWG